jgi:hypothetical protein
MSVRKLYESEINESAKDTRFLNVRQRLDSIWQVELEIGIGTDLNNSLSVALNKYDIKELICELQNYSDKLKEMEAIHG